MLDSKSQMALAPVTSGIIDGILPSGQLIPYPENNFEMMTATVRILIYVCVCVCLVCCFVKYMIRMMCMTGE